MKSVSDDANVVVYYSIFILSFGIPVSAVRKGCATRFLWILELCTFSCFQIPNNRVRMSILYT